MFAELAWLMGWVPEDMQEGRVRAQREESTSDREGASLLNEGEKEVRMRPPEGMGLSRGTRPWGN